MSIHIKPSHRGLFTAKANAHGEGVQQYAREVLAPGSHASAATRKQANFARNFGGHGEHHHAQHSAEPGPRHHEAHEHFSAGHAAGHTGSGK